MGFLLLGAIWGGSTLLVWSTKVPFPPALVGLLIFFLLLYTRIIPEKWIQPACDFLLNHIIIFFIPIVVGVVVYTDLLLENWILLTVMIVVPGQTNAVSLTGLGEWMVHRKTKKDMKR